MRVVIALLLILFGLAADAATLRVGPGRSYPTLQSVAGRVVAGDVVEVDGGATYPGGVVFNRSGTTAAPITIRGLRVNGARPALRGVNGIAGGAVLRIAGSHYVIEGLDCSTGGDPLAARCVYHAGDGAVIRDCVVHDSPCDGISGADASGSLTLQNVEVHHCGAGGFDHQIYVASSNANYPAAVFRMEFCYVHDGTGGNNVKSRVGRNEIYDNWIETAAYHELDLIGADAASQPGTAALVREDSDVVGNVLIHTSAGGNVGRLGGDGSGASRGRYRFVGNTVIIAAALPRDFVVFKLQDVIESIEVHNNVFEHAGKTVRVLSSTLAGGSAYARAGANNWLPAGSANPAGWTGTVSGSAPGFANAAAGDFAPSPIGALFNGGADSTQSPAGFAFPSPLAAPLFHPPVRALGSPVARPINGAIDIGAFEHPRDVVDNAAPVAMDDDVITASIAAFPIDVLANDTDTERDALVVISATQAAAGSVGLSGNKVIYTPGPAFAGSDTFSYRISDGHSTATANVTLRNPFVATRGVYNGLLADSAAPATITGFFKIATTGTGSFSGTLRLAGGTFVLSGAFNLAGDFAAVIPRAYLAPLQVALHLDFAGAVVSGSVSDGATTATLGAERVIFSTANRAPQTGKYTLHLPVDPLDDAPEFPHGIGYALMSIASDGRATIAGKFADGSALSVSAWLLPDGTLPVYMPLYSTAARGMVAGSLGFRETPASDCDALLTWRKPAQPSGTLYRAGFDTTIMLAGSRYAAPRAGTCVLQLADSPGNAGLRLSDGNLSAPMAKSLTIATTNLVTIDEPAADKLSMRITAANGLFTGAFIHPVTRTARTIGGVLFQKTPRGAGFFSGTSETGAAEVLPR